MSSSPDIDAGDLEQMRKSLFGEFEELLRAQGNIDAANRDSLLRHFQEALNDPEALSAPVDIGKMQADVAETLGLMQQHGLIDADDGEEMSKVFAKTLQPLQDESLQRATEFSRRCREDGQDSAREWLAGQAAAKQERPPQAIPPHVASALQPGAERKRR